ncbi:MAG: zinc ribbon domain-containing protein [Candidatus Odinarchaeota archaeon]
MIGKILTITDAGDDHMTGGFGMFGMGWFMWPVMILLVVLFTFLIAWTYQDASKRDGNALLWALVIVFTMGFGIIVYTIVRNAEPESNRDVNKDKASPGRYEAPREQYKGSKGYFCENCGVPLKTGDRFCSSCGAATV